MVSSFVHHKTSSSPAGNTSPVSVRPFETHLEGLRGIAALLVGLKHAFDIGALDGIYRPAAWFRYLEAGQGAVLVFFMLSGYVIGLTNIVPFSGIAAKSYILRRAIRLLPIYIAAWLLAVAINVHAGARSIFGTLFFLQNFDPYFGLSIPPLARNGPVWTLNYEAVYYLAFLLFWWKRPSQIANYSVAILVCAAGWFVPGFPVFLSGYACGWIFWSFGWWLSQQSRKTGANSYGLPALSSVFLLVSVDHFKSGQVLLESLHLGRLGSHVGMVDFSSLACFPACAALLICATGRRVQLQWVIGSLAFAIPLGTLGVLLAQGRLFGNPLLASAAIGAGVACGLAWFLGRDWLAWFAPFGSISYAFYLFHLPMLSVVRRFPGLPVGDGTAFLLRLALWMIGTAAIAWALERRLQPWVRERFKRRKPTATAIGVPEYAA
jgi:peptidoglycan/LPS O-acetylase OafA/YrhL